MINIHDNCGGQWGIVKTPIQSLHACADQGLIIVKCWKCKELGYISEVSSVYFKKFEDIKPNVK